MPKWRCFGACSFFLKKRGPKRRRFGACSFKKKTDQNDAVLALFPFQPPFSGIFELDTTPNHALASAVQWKSEEEEEDEEK